MSQSKWLVEIGQQRCCMTDIPSALVFPLSHFPVTDGASIFCVGRGGAGSPAVGALLTPASAVLCWKMPPVFSGLLWTHV
eukprot:CAMPEP_0174371148 /NCGR_PEP_ID=MMETSP0811_2-20130205/98746_1 /TAXON_ID=73025 ORGANISM="Eutreptiella gymnastica-like, Strain CCMP1594" /NCGR_SAMPLE_ID=MMETSP0811_2 /ASSEMBLY_ACC=CAM_ASM_000667 /LENGTH=79 /DNA_ID=CAMNT_0015517265 /DNA_START=95 /DNA_END=334 /DNA_ORIENTATION=+